MTHPNASFRDARTPLPGRPRPNARRRTRRNWVSLLPAAMVLAACATTPIPTTVDVPGMPSPENALRQSLQHVDAEMAQLGRYAPHTGVAAAPLVPENLQRTVSFNWSGSLDAGVAKLAQSVGYTFYTTAPPGTSPLPVAVQLDSVPALQVFRALGEAAGTRATVSVDPLHHQVQVIYHVQG